MKRILLPMATATLMLSATITNAQEKYGYATLIYPATGKLSLSINGTDYQEFEILKDDKKSPYDTNAALKQIGKMNEEGWELIDTGQHTGGANTMFVLRRRKK